MTEAERLAAMTDDEWLAYEQEVRERAYAGFGGTDIRALLAHLWESAERVPVWQRRALEQEYLADLDRRILRVSRLPGAWAAPPDERSDQWPVSVQWLGEGDA